MDGTTTPQPAETPSAPAPSGGAREEQPEKAKGSKRKKELTPQQRERATKRQAISRELEACMSAKDDPEVLQRALEALKAARKGEALAVAQPAAAAPSATPAPQAPRTPAPGWPTDEATLRARPLAQAAVNSISLAMGLLTEVDLSRPRQIPGLEEPVVFTDMLVKDSAPVLALYAPDAINTPWGALACTALTVATVVVAELVMRKAEAEHARTEAKKVEGAGSSLAQGGATA